MADRKPFTLIAAGIFLLVALVHLYRLTAGFDVVIAGSQLGQGPSIAGLLICVLLAVMLVREARR